MTKNTRSRAKKGAGVGKGEGGTQGDGSINKNDARERGSKDSGKQKPPSNQNDNIPAAMMCLPAAAEPKQAAKANNSSDVAMLLDLSRRQMAMQQAGGAASGLGGTQKAGGGSALANYAGITADSFAQSFVDRWAGKMGGDEIPTSPRTGRNTMLSSWPQQQMHHQGGSNGMGESEYRMMAMMQQQQQLQQVGWRVCAFCQNGGFMTYLDLQEHEANCPLRGRGGVQLGMGMMSTFGQHAMNPIHQQVQQQQMGQMNNSFLGCLPIGTSIPAADSGAAGGTNSDGLQFRRGDSKGMMVPGLPPFPVSYADVNNAASSKAAPSKERNTTKRTPAVPKEDDPEIIENSKGPFKTLDEPILLALDEDDYWLTPLHCFVRKHCVEVFTVTPNDIQKTPSKGKRRNVTEGQIGIRCPHCNKSKASNTKPDQTENDVTETNDVPIKGSVYYPNSISNVYNATMNLLQRHIFFCPDMPSEILKTYSTLKKDDARSGTSKMYWQSSAKSLGFVDTLSGIKLSAKPPPPLPSVDSVKPAAAAARKRTRDVLAAEVENADDAKDGESEVAEVDTSALVFPDDEKFTQFSYLLMSQMQRCLFTEADRLGKRKGLVNGYAGLACRHCFGGFGSGRFFPSSLKTLSDTSKTLDVIFHHLERCREVPKTVIDDLVKAKKIHEAERAGTKFGSQKAFFSRIWDRLHKNRADGLKIDPPPQKVYKKRKKSSTTTSNDHASSEHISSEELKRFRDNITRMSGQGGNIMNSMMGGLMNPALMNAMSGGGGGGGGGADSTQPKMVPKNTDGNKKSSDESDQTRHAEV